MRLNRLERMHALYNKRLSRLGQQTVRLPVAAGITERQVLRAARAALSERGWI